MSTSLTKHWDDYKDWYNLIDKLDNLKRFNTNIKNRIMGVSIEYINIKTRHLDVAVKLSDVYSFMIDNHIKDLEIYGDWNLYDSLSTIKLDELQVRIFTPMYKKYWIKLIHWVKTCTIKKLNLDFALWDNEVKYVLELLKIPTLIALQIRSTYDVSIESEQIVLNELEKNYKILEFNFTLKQHERRCAILERNMIIRDDWIHYKVLDFAITMCPLIDIGFGAYVLLEIFDWLSWNHLANHHIKIRILENVCRFRRIKLGID